MMAVLSVEKLIEMREYFFWEAFQPQAERLEGVPSWQHKTVVGKSVTVMHPFRRLGTCLQGSLGRSCCHTKGPLGDKAKQEPKISCDAVDDFCDTFAILLDNSTL